MKVTIEGIQAAQRDNLKMIASLKPGDALGDAIKHGLTAAHRYAVSITHVDTGALRASHRMRMTGLRGEIYIDPSSRSPIPGKRTRPYQYGYYEHMRGGKHAFYQRTRDEAGPSIGQAAAYAYIRRLP